MLCGLIMLSCLTVSMVWGWGREKQQCVRKWPAWWHYHGRVQRIHVKSWRHCLRPNLPETKAKAVCWCRRVKQRWWSLLLYQGTVNLSVYSIVCFPCYYPFSRFSSTDIGRVGIKAEQVGKDWLIFPSCRPLTGSWAVVFHDSFLYFSAI